MDKNNGQKPEQQVETADKQPNKELSEFIIGVVTFIAFIAFMAVWMKFSV